MGKWINKIQNALPKVSNEKNDSIEQQEYFMGENRDSDYLNTLLDSEIRDLIVDIRGLIPYKKNDGKIGYKQIENYYLNKHGQDIIITHVKGFLSKDMKLQILTEREFYPAMATWGVEPKIVGWDLPIPWVSVYDLGQAVANVFEDPEKWIGKEVPMCGDIKTLGESQAIFTAVDGRKPSRIPLPIRLFEKMAGDEFVAMWKWMDEWIGREGVPYLMGIMEQSHELVPEMLDMESWLRKKRNGGFG